MSVQSCEKRVVCFPCADDNPFANLSAEDPDLNLFLSLQFRRVPNPPPNNWGRDTCVGFCESTISQVDADDCARRRAFECVPDEPPPDPRQPDWPTPLYCNTAMSFQHGDRCYDIPACAVFAFSQLEANAVAQSLGNFRVRDSNISEPCPISAPPPVTPPVPPPPEPEPECEPESGSAAPTSLAITAPQNWETWTFQPSDLNNFATQLAGCTPATQTRGVAADQLDHAPGVYGIRYISGYFKIFFPFGPPDPYIFEIRKLENAEHNSDSPPECAVGLADNLRDMPGNPPPSGDHGLGMTDFFFSGAAAQSAISAYFANRIYCSNPYPPDGINEFEHSNNGGTFQIIFTGSTPDIEKPVPVIVQVLQLAGLIPQPRKLQVDSYNPLEFADPVGAAGWNGAFNTRDTYSASDLRWLAPASGLFGGATLKFTMAHPTSVNGKGWQLDIFSVGMILMWRGFKAVGNTSIGRYYRDSTSTPDGPPCLICSDNSDTEWEP